eukprot:11217232-Lingulodinium_polyedra.AAC.1
MTSFKTLRTNPILKYGAVGPTGWVIVDLIPVAAAFASGVAILELAFANKTARAFQNGGTGYLAVFSIVLRWRTHWLVANASRRNLHCSLKRCVPMWRKLNECGDWSRYVWRIRCHV